MSRRCLFGIDLAAKQPKIYTEASVLPDEVVAVAAVLINVSKMAIFKSRKFQGSGFLFFALGVSV
ncbi:hypothetical protein JOC77_004224 [Peribacillus deserti]|uniref:IS110 family transposase n=1 Tax=Peribacillus deserti TaxID=673318 RepID=A0ABS2QNK3_9BACI|nr:hypothetical protein [Peribacillus deserti]MBM7694747.1 hypothetical protein [Peribacillus deserti]